MENKISENFENLHQVVFLPQNFPALGFLPFCGTFSHAAKTFLTIDHGSFGATPRVIINSLRKFQDSLESQPVRFFTSLFRPWMVAALRRLAPFVGAPSAESLVFVDNASSGVLAAVQSVDWKAGDSILYLDIGYGPIIKFIRTYSKKMGFKLIEVRVREQTFSCFLLLLCPQTLFSMFQVPIPIDMNALVASVESHLHAEGTTTRLAIVDHITSGTGLILPVKELINVRILFILCKVYISSSKLKPTLAGSDRCATTRAFRSVLMAPTESDK